MKKQLIKKLLSLTLAATMMVPMTGTAFAAWNQFQGDAQNSGSIAGAMPTSVNNTNIAELTANDAWTGVDAAPLVGTVDGDEYVYTLYNGGNVNGDSGGARLARTSADDAEDVVDVQVDGLADNVSQLSTPYMVGNKVYTATTHMGNLLSGTGLAGWKKGNQSLGSSEKLSIGDTVTYTYEGVNLTKQYLNLQVKTNMTVRLNTAGQTFTARMELVNSDGTVYNLGENSYAYSSAEGTTVIRNFTVYNQTAETIPAGSYTLRVTFSNHSASDITFSSLQLMSSQWSLYSVEDDDGDLTVSEELASGDGQINTPIKACGQYLYFGAFGGARSYFQYDVNTGNISAYTPNGGDDFYWAGATDVDINGTTYMVFGSDSGKLYVRPVGSGFAQGAGNVISVSDSPIRSSIVNAGNGYIYFSSLNTKIRGTSISSLLGAPTFSVITLDQSSSVSCTSTPAVSVHTAADGTKSYYLYCTYNHIYEEDNQKVERGGAVVLYIVDGNLNTLRTILAPSTNYDAIKGSPVVKNVDANNDYVYFTFNGKTGGAIGYRYNLDTYTSLLWKFTPQADEGYAVQGMAAGSNFLVYGDDNNLLYFLR